MSSQKPTPRSQGHDGTEEIHVDAASDPVDGVTQIVGDQIRDELPCCAGHLLKAFKLWIWRNELLCGDLLVSLEIAWTSRLLRGD